MVRKIQTSEYLKRYNNMTAAERDAYQRRVGDWMKKAGVLKHRADDPSSRLQNVMQLSAWWNDVESQLFENGAKLLTALEGREETWLPDLLYAKSAKRAIHKIITSLGNLVKHGGQNVQSKQADSTGQGGRNVRGEQAAYVGRDGQNVRGKREDSAEGGAKQTGGAGDCAPVEAENARKTENAAPIKEIAAKAPLSGIPSRPKHIDQYVHLLPAKTQERAAMVRGLLRDMDVAREKARLLMDAPNASDEDRAEWAKKATSLDDTLRSIYKELDAEWEKLVESGRVVVDEFGVARVNEAEGRNAETPKSRNAEISNGMNGIDGSNGRDVEMSKSRNSEISNGMNRSDGSNEREAGMPGCRDAEMPKKGRRGRQAKGVAESEEDKKRAASLLRKFLIDRRNANTPLQRKKWKAKYKELIKVGGEEAVTQKVKETAEFYGIKLKIQN